MNNPKTKSNGFFTVSFKDKMKEEIATFGSAYGTVSNTIMVAVKVAKVVYKTNPKMFFDIVKNIK